MTIREPEKGRRYIATLDTARCHGNWQEVPELVRKITKHTPWRKCLIQTATAEHRIASHINKIPAPAKSPVGQQPSNLSDLIPLLLSSIEEENDFPQDIFQAQVCLGWVHWTLSEPALAALRLPKDLDVTMHDLSGDGQGISSWTEVCVIKAGYMKGTAQSLVSGFDEAIQTFNSVLPWLSNSSSNSNPQFLYWSEQMLAKGALMASQNVSGQGQLANERVVEFALKSFRLWASHAEVKRGSSTAASHAAPADHSVRTSIWMTYYHLLSEILQHKIPYIPPSERPKRVHLSTEFRRVQSICENALLKDVKFPKANSSNKLVEDWVEQVVHNWEVLHGPEWNDEDFGEGGQDAVARNVLDILYRAASKTFHSTLILRRLFHVHSAMSEFELAIKALDSYVEIVTSAKDRAEKSAEAGGELEDDETLLRTVAEGILVLCCFGSCKEAEKAESLAGFVKGIISSHATDMPCNSTTDGTGSVNSADPSAGSDISPKILSMAHQAIGIGFANWSRWTPESECRDDIHLEAIDNLEKSLALEPQNKNVAATFALGLLLAETRDLDTAVDRVRTALGSNARPTHLNEDDTNFGEEQGLHLAERDRVPLWHLLALLLSAKQEFETAGRSCEAAFEQFSSAAVLFGSDAVQSQREHSEKAHSTLPATGEGEYRGIVDKMDGREKERIIEIRMTQLALTEALEGPEAALNHSDELLSLFARLFRQLGISSDERPKKENLAPPKSSAGTVKSTRGSVFGWRRSSKIPGHENEAVGEIRPVANLPSTTEKNESGPGGEAPAIQVTDEDHGSVTERPRTGRTNSLRHQDGRHKLQKRESSHVKQHNREGPLSVGSSSIYSSEPPSDDKGHPNGHQRLQTEDMSSPVDVGMAISSGISSMPTSPTIGRNLNHNQQSPTHNSKQITQLPLQLPTNHRFDSPTWASTRFTKEQSQKHALSVLVKIWLLVAGLYRRASLFEDAREACEEASKQAARVETMTAAQESSARAFTNEGFGGSKSSDELRADICSERGCISQAQDLAFEALEHFEQAVMYWPDHTRATVKLSNLLLDIYDQTLPAEPPQPKLNPEASTLSLLSPRKPKGSTDPAQTTASDEPDVTGKHPSQKREAEHINRLAARDRAYGLLSTLTKLGGAWDNSEAWLAMARAYEAGGQIEKTKEVLWWCVELEDRRPIRHWWNLGSGGYVL